jgi:adenine phosphoribosyltransferase
LDPQPLRQCIRDIPDFPKPGIVFKDITPLLADSDAFRSCILQMGERTKHKKIDKIVGVESRGFIFASALAFHLQIGLVLVRKPRKLPFLTTKIEYTLEYGIDILEIHVDALQPKDRVLIVDDILATGGTALATAQLVEQVGGQVDSLVFFADLPLLKGRDRLKAYEVITLLGL